MKTLFLSIALLIGAAGTSPAQLSFGGGAQSSLAFTSFAEPLKDFFGTGYGGGVHGDLTISPPLTVRLSFDYNRFASDKTKLKQGWIVIDQNGNLTNDFTVEGADVTIIGITANVIGKLSTHSSIRPYGVAGFGLQFSSLSDQHVILNGQTIGEQRGPNGSTNFGANIGAGVEFALGGRTSLYLEPKYTLIFATGGTSSYFPVTFGITF